MSLNPSKRRLIEQGYEQLDKGDYAAALEIFHQAAAEAPQNHEVLYGLGLACYRLERYSEAVEYLNQALGIKPNYILALVRRGLAYGELKKTQQAEVDFQQAIALTPEDAEDWRGRGIAFDELGRYEDAIVSYEKAIEIKSDDYKAWINRGNALFYLERYEDGIASYNKAIEIKPDDYTAWGNRGIALDNLGRYESAVAAYNKAIEIKPDYHYAWFNRGNALFNLERYEDAIASYNKAIEIKPDDYDTWFERGSALFNLERYEEAAAVYNKAIEIKPGDYYAWNNQGIALGNLGRYEDAIASFNKAIEINPDDDYAWVERGSALSNLGRYEDAVTDYEKAIEINPDDYDVWNNRGDALNDLGRYEEAVAAYNKAIEIKPDDYHAWFSRGGALFNLERYEEAVAAYNKAIEIKPDDYHAWNNRGTLLDELGRYEEAIASYNKAIEINPDDDYAWVKRGSALSNLGRYEDAVADFDKAIEINPNDNYAWFNRGNTLDNLKRHEDAIASYNKAIEIKTDDYDAWNNLGVALSNLKRHEEAIAPFDQALRLTDYQEWTAWGNRGVALLKSKGYKPAIKTWDDGIKALKPENPDCKEGCGELYRQKGKILYEYATEESEPFTNWFAAKDSYEKALNFFSFDNDTFRDRHLQVLQELLKVCSALGDERASQKYIEKAAQRLEELLAACETKGQKITLERKYAAFNQLRVDIKLQSNEVNKEIAALELAEKRKNTCLAWLQENWDYQPPKLTYQDIQSLLNPKTAAIFWHISPNAITTFIIKRDRQPIVLSPQSSKNKKFNFFGNSQQSEESKAYLEQLQNFQNWIEEWKQDYQNYCQEDYIDTTKETAPWRTKMKSLLNELGKILEINRITEQLGGIEQLILIPHRELHLLPLDYLFSKRFNIIYLPSFQIGFKFNRQFPIVTKSVSQLLNVTTNDLVFNTIESTALSTIYDHYNRLEILSVKPKSLTTALQKNSGYFHFTGHGYHVPDNPRESALVLAESEQLTLADIIDNEQLDLSKYELICLSACETGITSTYSLVDEYVGLVSGFLAKGATYVLSTLWTVDERSSALLMIQFYQLMQQGKTPAIALKQAKEWLRQLTYEKLATWYCDLSDKLYEQQCKEYLKTEALIIQNDSNKITSMETIYEDPYYWAGFILTGKPG